MTGTLPHVLRSDAQGNRDRVLEAARELFAESGLGVTMRQIARRAGVGPATLYRRFPTKRDLVLEAFTDELGACGAIVREAAADPDPWRGFCGVIERVTVLNARNQGFTDAFMAEHPSAIDFAAHRAELTREIATISRRAIAAGELRADFVLDDFMLVLIAGRGLATVPAGDRVAAARRLAALTIEGLRARDANYPLPKSPRLAPMIISAGPPAGPARNAWLKKPSSVRPARAVRIAAPAGTIKNARRERRSMSPWRPRMRPETKSMMRVASALSTSSRLMMTGISWR